MNKLGTLYKRTATGSIQQWTIVVDGNTYYTLSGKVMGKITKSKPTICDGKNIGRANETSPEQQALAEATSKWEKKLKKDYSLEKDDVDEAKTRIFLPMLAHPYAKQEDKIDWDQALASRKYDGIRCIVTKDGAFSREGGRFYTVPHILNVLEPIFTIYPEAIFDGELYNHELKADFEKITSLVKRVKVTEADLLETATLVQYHIYDCPQIGELTMKDGFKKRFDFMCKILTNDFNAFASELICPVPANPIESFEQLNIFHDMWVADGWEGAILRIANGPYEQKRSQYLLKYKKFFDEEFPIVDILPGKGNKATMAAKAVVKVPNGETCSVGIIGDQEYATKLLNEKADIIGKPGTVQYVGWTKYGKLRMGKLKIVRDYE